MIKNSMYLINIIINKLEHEPSGLKKNIGKFDINYSRFKN